MKWQLGFSLIEVLIAMALFSQGVIVVAGMQMVGLKMSGNSNALNTASTQIYNMADRMLANPQGVKDNAYDAITGSETNPSCGTSCTTAQLAQADAYAWSQSISSLLPSGAGTVSKVSATDLFTISISWTERGKESDETKIHRLTFLPYQP